MDAQVQSGYCSSTLDTQTQIPWVPVSSTSFPCILIT